MNNNTKQNSSMIKDKIRHLMDIYNNKPKNENNQTTRAIDFEKQKNAVEKCCLLYEKAKIKNEIDGIMFLKNLELKQKQEIDGCTFKPQVNKTYKNIANQKYFNKFDNSNAHNRNIYWKSRSIEK